MTAHHSAQTAGQVRASSQPTTSCRACLPALLVKVDRMAIVVSRLLGTVCRSGGGHLVRAHGRQHVRVLRILDDVSTGGWRGYFTDLLVVLEGTRWCVHHGGRAERRATVRGAERRASRGTRKGRPMLREGVRRPPGRTATERPLAAGPPDAAHRTSTEPHGTSGSARLALSTCAEGRGELAWKF